MKITIVTSAFIPLPPAGGGAIEKVWDGLSREFARRGHDVTVFSNQPPGLSPSETVEGVKFQRIRSLGQARSAYANVLRAVPYATTVLSRLEEADVLVVNDTATLALLPPMNENLGRLVINLQRLPKGPAMRVLYAKAWKLAAVSEAVRQAVRRAVPDLLDRTVVIGNPSAVEVFRARGRERALEGDKTIFYTGRIHPEKGLHLLARAFRRVAVEFPAARLRLVGESRIDRGGGGEAYLAELRASLEGLDARILPPVNDAGGLANTLRDARYYCYPSLAEAGETFGVAVLEACASGLVPIVSDLPAFRELVTNGETGFVFDHRKPDPETELVASLRKVLSLPCEELWRLGEAASRRAMNFSFEKIASRYLELFAEAAA